MPRHRPLAAIVLYGGWLLLVNPKPDQPYAPLSSWKKVDEYDTGYSCQEKLHKEVQAAAKADAKDVKPGARITPAAFRYRCERAERVPPPR
jgi:hypothetical protein